MKPYGILAPASAVGMDGEATVIEFGYRFPTKVWDYSQMSDNLDRYIPEFDESDARAKLAGYTREQLIDMLIYAYKLRPVIMKDAEQDTASYDAYRKSSPSLRVWRTCQEFPQRMISGA